LYALLEQNVFVITLKGFDDNMVLKKLSIGYTNICSSSPEETEKFLRSFIGSG